MPGCAFAGQCNQANRGGSALFPCRRWVPHHQVFTPVCEVNLTMLTEHCFADFVPSAGAVRVVVGHGGCLFVKFFRHKSRSLA